ncbi:MULTISPECIES: thioredoxin family protein [unclassified Beijerinckia]|uniref:DUF899 domain-containing protein n=1 Tax=unclassified Beijerinckia TaxID=2638183 RepID=UPI00089743F3|nr:MULTISPECIES: thioredoxin family protein [unclassified Beijerinckia]MDH7798767.1 putative dithiol-disulfide oxidoreductase (DUF899 family) [Beijerinckia sp. GAS462]SED32476.1 Predicted dithiol-disulfide oxidoreductase, DUF899 family [Beijerinckia sp. 28-YEA-48]
MANHPVVSRAEWLKAREALLLREKEHTRARDQLNQERLALPWVKVDKTYTFDTPTGGKSLADLFDGRSQLIVYHFMLGPDWTAGCPGCSFLADHLDGARQHIIHHDVNLIAVSRATLPQIEAYRKRMAWKFPWVSSNGNDFNSDYHVSFTPEELAKGHIYYNYETIGSDRGHDELPGLSCFAKGENGEVFHTYSSYARGMEEAIGSLMLLDRAPKGRNEASTMNWVRRHDEYEANAKASCCA